MACPGRLNRTDWSPQRKQRGPRVWALLALRAPNSENELRKKRSRRCYRRLQAIHRGSVTHEPLFATLLAGVTNGLMITSGSGAVLVDAERSDGFISDDAGVVAGTYGLLIVTGCGSPT